MQSPALEKHIAHLDLDCFYVSVERTKNPELNGKPVVVGGSPEGRGVVASASYEARKFGVRSAMPTGHALRLCPSLIVVPGHYSEYERSSDAIERRLQELAPIVERASIDEFYLDFTGCEGLYGDDLPGFVKSLQATVWKEFALPCTIALAANKLVAKIAAATVKPNGVIHVPHGDEKKFLGPLLIDVIPGIGTKTAEVLRKHGFNLVSDLQSIPREKFVKILGKHGLWISSAANGLGSADVSPEHTRKSISREETFSHDISDRHELEKILFDLSEEVCSTLRSYRWKAKTVSIKIRYSDFKTITRAISIEPTGDDAVVYQNAARLLEQGYTRSLALRLLGVHLSNFVDERQLELPLFEDEGKREDVLDAVDKLRKKFGDEVIHGGTV